MEKGMIVEIKNRDMNGKEIIEGKAKLIKKIKDYGCNFYNSERWLVHFLDDEPGMNYERNIINCKGK